MNETQERQTNMTVPTSMGDVLVQKLPLGRYAELLKAIKKLPDLIKSIDSMKETELLANLPSMIGDNMPDVINILAIATPLTKDEVENKIGLDDAVELVLAVYKVNNYQSIFNRAKKAMAGTTVKPKTEPTE